MLWCVGLGEGLVLWWVGLLDGLAGLDGSVRVECPDLTVCGEVAPEVGAASTAPERGVRRGFVLAFMGSPRKSLWWVGWTVGSTVAEPLPWTPLRSAPALNSPKVPERPTKTPTMRTVPTTEPMTARTG